MNEAEFLDLADATLAHIESAFDRTDLDADLNLNGGVLEIEFDDGAKIIVNRHAPNKELWIAAKSGGFHYRHDGKQWLNTRNQGEFFAQLAELVATHAGRAPAF